MKTAPRLIALEKFDEFRLSAAGSLAYDIGELVAKLLWRVTPRSSDQARQVIGETQNMARSGFMSQTIKGKLRMHSVSVVQGLLDAQSRAKNDRLSAKNRLL